MGLRWLLPLLSSAWIPYSTKDGWFKWLGCDQEDLELIFLHSIKGEISFHFQWNSAWSWRILGQRLWSSTCRRRVSLFALPPRIESWGILTIFISPVPSLSLHFYHLLYKCLRKAYHIPSLFLLSLTPIPFASCLRFFGGSVTTEPAQNAPVLFNETLSCSSEKTDQNHKSCSWSMCTGENLDPQLYLEPKYALHLPLWNQRTRTEPKLEYQTPFQKRRAIVQEDRCWCPLPWMSRLQGPPAKTCPLCASIYLLPIDPYKLVLSSDSGSFSFGALAPGSPGWSNW